MTTRDRRSDRVFIYACEFAAEWRSILSDDGCAVGLTATLVDEGASDEVHDEHGRRMFETAAAMPVAVELLSKQTGRQVQLVFPVAIDEHTLGWGVRYSEEAGV